MALFTIVVASNLTKILLFISFSTGGISCIDFANGSRIFSILLVLLYLLFLLFSSLVRSLRLLKVGARGFFFWFLYLAFFYRKALGLYLMSSSIGWPTFSKVMMIGFTDI